MTRDIHLRATILTAFFIALIAVSGLAALEPVLQREKFKTETVRAVRMYRVGYASHIAMADFTDFPWDEVYIFPPYSTGQDITDALGFFWSGARANRIAETDAFTLLVFVHNCRVIRDVLMPRGEADFSTIAQASPLTPQSALFILPSENSPVLQVLR